MVPSIHCRHSMEVIDDLLRDDERIRGVIHWDSVIRWCWTPNAHAYSLGKTGKRLDALCKPRLWPADIQGLPAPSCIV